MSYSVDPVAMPTASPYFSQAGRAYYPIGSQNGMILSGTFDGLWSTGPSQYPSSNNFTLALEYCTKVCDSDTKCQSFNVLTVAESDFNSGIPTFECRFSPNLYTPADYYTDNGTPSYVWAQQPYEKSNGSAPACNLSSSTPINPDTWINLNMDAYLAEVAQSSGVANKDGNYLVNLMSALGWVGYTCTDDNANCNDDPLSSCGNLLNYQVVGFQGYMKNIETILESILTELDGTGRALFEQLWSPLPPADPTFDSWSITKDMINAAINLIPEVGGVIDLVVSPLLDIIPDDGSDSGDTSINANNYQASWLTFISNTQTKIDASCDAIYNQSATVTQSSDILKKVAAGGQWFLPDNTGPSFRPDVHALWPTLQPYFWSRVAMQGLQAQDVFLLSIPVAVESNAACTQAIADNFAAQFPRGKGTTSTGVAWCASSGQVIVPITGYDLALYTPWPTLLSSVGLTGNPNAILEPSSACYEGFGVTTTSIALYNSSVTLPPFQGTASRTAYDLTQPCAWAIPLCDYNTFLGHMQASKYPDIIKSSSWEEEMGNVAGYCAYNWNMINQINFCGKEYVCEDPEGCYWEDNCVSWKPTKIIQLLS